MTALTLPLFEPDAHARAIAVRDATWPHCQGAPLSCLQCALFANVGIVMADEPGDCAADLHATSAHAACTLPESFVADTRTFAERYPRYPEEYLSLTGAMWSKRTKTATGKVLEAAITGDAVAASLLSSAHGVSVAADYTRPDEAA